MKDKLEVLVQSIEQWAEDRNIIKGAKPVDQAMKLFSEFINDQSLTQAQIVFVRRIIDYIVQNGYFESVTELMKPPFDKPEIVILCIFEHSGFGSESAAPVVKDIMDAYFHYGAYAESNRKKDAGNGKEKV